MVQFSPFFSRRGGGNLHRKYHHQFKFKGTLTLTVALLVFIAETRSSPVRAEFLRPKRDAPNANFNSMSLSNNNQTAFPNSIKNGGNRLSSRQVEGNPPLEYGQLVILAQEEARCLQNFCRNLTLRVRSRDECVAFCTFSDTSFCQNLCFSINKAVLDGAQLANEDALTRRSSSSPTSQGDDDHEIEINNKTITSHSPVFSQTPQVFCEGVSENNAVGGGKSGGGNLGLISTEDGETDKWDNTMEITNHFVVLKWDARQQWRKAKAEGGGESGDEDREENFRHPNSSSRHHNGPVVFVIEKYSGRSKEWKALGKTLYNLQQINVTFLSDTYKWRVTAVSPSGFMDEVTSSSYVTNSSIVNVLIGWDPPQEKTCYYKIVLETHEGAEKPIRIKVSFTFSTYFLLLDSFDLVVFDLLNPPAEEPLGVHQHWFTLQAGTQYSILITSRDRSWDQYSESNLTRLDFKTPTSPPPPRGIETKIQENSDDSKTVRVLLTWKPPQNASDSNPILRYNVTISRLTFKSGGGVTGLMSSAASSSARNHLNLNGTFPYLNFSGSTFTKLMRPSPNANSNSNSTTVSGNVTHLKFHALEANAEYQVVIRAVSYRGSSKPAQHHLVTRIVKDPPVASPLSNWLYLAIPVCIMMLILVACNMGRVYLHKRQVKIARNQYFQSMEERDALSADWSIVPLTEETSTWKLFDDNFPKDKWEIVSENLIMGEVIGQGAFGVVRRAKIPRRKLQVSTLKYLDKASPRMDADRADADMETVAVKMLKVSATVEDREQLVKEIMTMQSLGFHPQIVGLIGACTRGRSLSLVLEYCSGGDLLTFIRKVRSKYWPTLGLSDAKKTSSASMSREMSCRTGSGSGGSGGARIKNLNSADCCNNESEDNSPINYADLEHFSDYSSSPKSEHQGNPLQSGETISAFTQFQEYLEKNRIVHRDLACRNCLLMGDHKQVKLSDFGLSRDIYTWNVYHQKSNGKLPIKWMAIESIFTHVFTTKSDVWSYGILLWELVTLGGTPYPGLGNTELFHLLKSGYRMERPDNCSEELYALMKKCWRTSPSARPNYTELRNYVQTMMETKEPNLYLSLMADIPSDYFRLGSRSDLLQINETTDGSVDLYNGSCTSNNGGTGSTRHSKKYAGYHNTNTTYPATSTSSTTTTPTQRHNPISCSSSSSGGGSGGAPVDLHSSSGSAKYSTKSGGETSRPGYSRSNSITSSSTNGKSSANSSGKFTLGSVPEKRSNIRGGGDDETDTFLMTDLSPPNSSPDLDPEPESSETLNNNNNLSKEPNNRVDPPGDEDDAGHQRPPRRHPPLQKMKKSRSTTDFDGGLSRGDSFMSRSPTNPGGSTLRGGGTPPPPPLPPSNSATSLQFPYPFRQVNNMTIIENKTYGLTNN
ncbi:Proto-oncogene tyrosine-protein kinase receptor Ret [Folsomia candida]|uniref:receptor protein-tyrosine kinase n=1 Tax=Folsomia candida TaxID=158441 RepID=A0A226DYL5_FOLCA|nr:Proto-oncogene tyrosine-protein kinase receptor Ret [Folsomia candida]